MSNRAAAEPHHTFAIEKNPNPTLNPNPKHVSQNVVLRKHALVLGLAAMASSCYLHRLSASRATRTSFSWI